MPAERYSITVLELDLGTAAAGDIALDETSQSLLDARCQPPQSAGR
jgi:hypothetical protein